MITLFDDQQQAFTDLETSYATGHKAPIFVAMCGFGKTVLFSAISQRAARKGKRVVIIAHRQELVDQISDTLNMFEVPHSFIASGYQYGWEHVQIASAQTLIKRVNNIPAPDICVIDEVHHTTKDNTLGRILSTWGTAKRLGVTATPCRLSGEGLGDCFDDLVLGPSAKELIAKGRLCQPKIFAPPSADTSQLHIRAGEFIEAESEAVMDKPQIFGDALLHYRKHADNKQFICFVCSIRHGEHVVADFNKNGYHTHLIHGGMDRYIRRTLIADYKAKRIRGLVSVSVLGEGLDAPGTEVGIFLRPTASKSLWLQQAGRVMRTAPGKEFALMLDHAGNCERLQCRPDDDQLWTLEGTKAKKQKQTPQIRLRICEKCWAANSVSAVACRECGYRWTAEGRVVPHVDGELEELTAARARIAARQDQGRAKTLQELMNVHIAQGHSHWTAKARATKILEAREKKGKKP